MGTGTVTTKINKKCLPNLVFGVLILVLKQLLLLRVKKMLLSFKRWVFFEEEELSARQDILHDHYTGTVEIEALCMIDMINQHVIPSVKETGVGPLNELTASVSTLKAAIAEIHKAKSSMDKAKLGRVLRLETMVEIRETCDAAEEVVPAENWTLSTYKEMLFIDSHTATEPEFFGE